VNFDVGRFNRALLFLMQDYYAWGIRKALKREAVVPLSS
jgi:hypothetical protein